MSSARGHKHSGSVIQNPKAQLANAYNELGKELSSTKIRVIGNYTLGKVIGEGRRRSLVAQATGLISIQSQEHMAKYD
jgi:hypothetical protein